ncbi:MFS transporter [Saccharothrix yanglingensis]|uniref:MFS transporter n=1 Tax=Saccharothrix yanglingensis TaxID=659496 RepID=A0ABU0WUW7_9PSEU|nr:MFS transporter [Saccharothrix yanglingensis]MDQ2583648.1 MFS transporter [Saccharothrix yanglingensis]
MSDQEGVDPARAPGTPEPTPEPTGAHDRPAGGPLVRAHRALVRILPPPGPQRSLLGSVFAVTVGGGMLLGSSTLYLTRVIGMSAVEVGFGLTAGAALGLAAGPLVGHVADRRGPREVHIITMLCGAAATAGFVFVRSFWALALVSLLTALVGAAGSASRAPLIRAVAGDRTTWFLSYQRAVSNVGVMLGILIATIGIQLDTGPVYVTMILASAVTFLVAGAVLTRLAHVVPLPVQEAHRRWVALTDRPYLAITLINGAMSVHLAIPSFALPLWIVDSTSVPRWAITAVILVNGVLIVGFQVRLSRGVVDPRSAGQRMRWAGGALLLASALIGLTALLPTWTAAFVLLLGVVVYTFGELWHAAASFELAFGLALPHAQGQYAGIFGLGAGAANAVGPALLAALCLDQGLPGWLALGALLLGLGLVTPFVVRWAQHSRLDAATRVPAPAEAEK